MKKATHKGHCQVCGNEQKLPNGVLSQHGYTVQWNMFQGVCWGAGKLPFEKDISLIEGAIERATAERDRLEALANAEAANDDPTHIWIHDYQSARFRNDPLGGYFWRLATDEEVRMNQEHGGAYLVYRSKLGRISRSTATRESNKKQYIEHVRAQANRFAAYIVWQRERIANWKPTELKPV